MKFRAYMQQRGNNGIPVFGREIYGSDFDIKPNEHCFWDSDYGFWRENDEHLRNRIKEMKNEKY